ncbi:dGTP triphosphohydrolase [Porphyromonas circumdentaria]|nr:dNTP triphosphohydrolase [Porphyromonas circumdentaria]MDO4722467.1 dNTP triphosphohydrolase [Porphyromonas circumdentaria]
MTWQKLLSDMRLGKEDEKRDKTILSSGAGRSSDFERDFDRLIFSAPFRRLQNKAQVFPLPGNVFVHNRLTHSLEVSCVGRSLGNNITRRLQGEYGHELFDPLAIASIVSSACLAHDMGNPPFGHSGERAISNYFADGAGKQWEEQVRREGGRWEDFLHFEGNANTFRLLTHQFEGRRKGGFALTYTTLASVVKYPFSSIAGQKKGKFGFFETEQETFQTIADHLGLLRFEDNPLRYARHPLVFLVEAADDICYQIMDLEDACKLRLLGYQEVIQLMLDFFSEEEQAHIQEIAHSIDDKNERIAYVRSKVINLLVEECSEAFLRHEREILEGTFQGALIKVTSERCARAYRNSSEVARKNIYVTQDVVDVELAGHRIFEEIIDRMMYALLNPDNSYSKTFLKRVSSQYNTGAESLYGKIQCTLDFLSGMTDLYALDLYRKLTGMNLPAV